jgi:2-succinyl-6-hydroxy-2,4-cyclohexadiene-1-carboxylate synthase
MSRSVLPTVRRGRGPALMLLHGFAGSAGTLADVAGAFEQEYETIVPDLPGHGRSATVASAAGYGFDACLDDLVATLESTGHARAHWLGSSMGARLALGCALRHPGSVASLVLVGGRAGIADRGAREERRRADEALADRIESLGVEAFLDEWLAQPLFDTRRCLEPGVLARDRRARLGNDARGLAASLRSLGPGAQPPLFDALSRVTVPVLLVAGALDIRFVELAHDLARRLPLAEVREIPGAGHAAHLERPEAFIRVARDHLRRTAGAASSDLSNPLQEFTS